MRQAKFCLQGVTLFSKAISRLILKQVMGCLTRNRAHSNQFGFVQYNFDSRGPNYTVCLLRNRMKSYKFHQMVMEGFGLLVGARVQQHTMQSFCFFMYFPFAKMVNKLPMLCKYLHNTLSVN